MKFSVPSLLRASVFMLAMVSAFAFTQPLKFTTGYGAERNDENQVVSWHPVDLKDPQHDCNELITVGCVYEQPSENSTMISEGKFIP